MTVSDDTGSSSGWISLMPQSEWIFFTTDFSRIFGGVVQITSSSFPRVRTVPRLLEKIIITLARDYRLSGFIGTSFDNVLRRVMVVV